MKNKVWLEGHGMVERDSPEYFEYLKKEQTSDVKEKMLEILELFRDNISEESCFGKEHRSTIWKNEYPFTFYYNGWKIKFHHICNGKINVEISNNCIPSPKTKIFRERYDFGVVSIHYQDEEEDDIYRDLSGERLHSDEEWKNINKERREHLLNVVAAFQEKYGRVIGKGNTLSYRGYRAIIEFSAEDSTLFGKVMDIDDKIIFEVDNPGNAKSIFKKVIDDYTELRKEMEK